MEREDRQRRNLEEGGVLCTCRRLGGLFWEGFIVHNGTACFVQLLFFLVFGALKFS